MTTPIHKDAIIKKVSIELEAEVLPKGQIFIILPKSRFLLHRENLERYMFLDKKENND